MFLKSAIFVPGKTKVGSVYIIKNERNRIGPQVLAFYRNLLNLRLLFKNQKKLRLSSVVSFLNVAERYAKKN